MALVHVQFKSNPFNLILFFSGISITDLWHERGNISYIFIHATLRYTTLIYTHISLECSHMYSYMFLMHSEHNKLVYYYYYYCYTSRPIRLRFEYSRGIT